MKKILFIIDKIELKYFEFNNLVTNFWMIKEFLERGNEVFITTIPNLSLKQDKAFTKCFETFESENNIFYKDVKQEKEIDEFDLVMFRLIQISENSNKLTDNFKNYYTDMPWRATKGLRNRIVHDYGQVDLSVVYDTIKYDIPGILEILHNIKS